jgi:hypothetical protein
MKNRESMSLSHPCLKLWDSRKRAVNVRGNSATQEMGVKIFRLPLEVNNPAKV